MKPGESIAVSEAWRSVFARAVFARWREAYSCFTFRVREDHPTLSGVEGTALGRVIKGRLWIVFRLDQSPDSQNQLTSPQWFLRNILGLEN